MTNEYECGVRHYMVLDRQCNLLARAVLESPPESGTLQIRVLDGLADTVLEHEIVQLVGMEEDTPALLGRILRGRGDRLSLQQMETLGADIRKNLRIPVEFDSFIYPLTGTWKGRETIRSMDLSCGGIAFACKRRLEEGERLEVVIPVTRTPVILPCQLLRTRELPGGLWQYAAKFVDTIHDEETLVREAVFGIQIRDKPKSAAQWE